MNALVEEVRRKVMRDVPAERTVRWEVGDLRRAHADPFMLRLVIENLLSNSVSYSRNRPDAVIEVGRLPPSAGSIVSMVPIDGHRARRSGHRPPRHG